MFSINIGRRFALAASVAALTAAFASPAAAQDACDLNGVQQSVVGLGVDTLKCGDLSAGGGGTMDNSTLIGMRLKADGDNLTLIGAYATGGSDARSFGVFDPPLALGITAVGAFAVGGGAGAVAVGDQATVGVISIGGAGALTLVTPVSQGTAIGSSALVTADHGTAVGASARVSGVDGTAIGFFSDAGANAAAVGANADAGTNGVAIGGWAFSTSTGIAIGSSASENDQTFAGGQGSIAIGRMAETSSPSTNSVAIGTQASVNATNSVAIGAGSVANENNVISVGSTGSERRIVNVAAGIAPTDAVNVSQLNAVTTDITALETVTATHTTQIAAIETVNTTQSNQIAAIETVNTAQSNQITAIEVVNATQSGQISALEAASASMAGSIDTLFDLRSRDRRDMKQGVAAAMAMANAPMPSGPGVVSYAVNGAMFRGEYAVGGSLMYRLPTDTPIAINAGFSFAGNKNNGVRLGVAGEF